VLVCFNKHLRAEGERSLTHHARSGAFSEADLRMLAVYGRIVGAVQAYVETMRSQQGKLRSNRALIEVAMTLTANLQGSNLKYNICELARQLVPCEWATLYVVDGALHHLHEVREDGKPGVVLKPGEGVVGAVARSMAVVVIRDRDVDPRFDATHYGVGRAARVREVLALPIVDSHGDLKAVLELCNRVGAPTFRRSDEIELQPFCMFAGITLHNARSLQVAQRTQHGTRLERRRSMIGVRRSGGNEKPASADAADAADADPLAAANMDPLMAAQLAAEAFEEAQASSVELGLLSERKMRMNPGS